MRIRVVGCIIALGALLAPPAAIGLAAQDLVTCPDDMDPALTGLAGVVRDTIQGIIISGATVSATWGDAQGQRRWVSVQTDRRGAYVLCGLPSGTSLTVQARVALSLTQPVVVNIAPGAPAGWDIGMGVEMRTAGSLFHVPGRIVGRVVDRRSGRPVQAVTVTLMDEDQQRVTDGNGRYTFDEIDPGVYQVAVEHLAYENVDQVVELPSDRTLQVNFELSVDPIELAPLVVTAVREKRLELQGFYDRREFAELSGAGVFLTRDDIQDTGAIRVTHYLGRIPGLRTECTGSGNNNCVVRMTRGAPSLSSRAEWGCMNANVYVDGVRVIRDNAQFTDSIDNFVSPSEIAGIEVYRGPSELPAEFGGSVGRCGAIVIWTGPAGSRRSN
ncbi:carboxypeptidase regulatory-like domain-containing protein [Candidatus Palauibacter sp.]|uniref:carboxypeptidase regulatory-like domain-containing protein n=1 Tax=Candidatus Palauibacter sp. TaxID=3101350 RepID=UPI003AF2730F